MAFTDNAMCAILLCSRIGIAKDSGIKPFSQKEWQDFLDRVIERGMEPKAILGQDGDWAEQLMLTSEEEARIRALCQRGAAVAFELEELGGRGIEVTTVLDPAYPVLMKRRLKRKAPPVLFYAGDLSLAGKVGIGVAGSRNVDEDGIMFTEQLAMKAAAEKLVVYSGGAKGVDTIAETAAIENGGAAVVFIADDLSSRIKKSAAVNNLMAGKLLLVSDVKPGAGFNVARAMNRNKYIYSSAYGSFVVSSDYNKGGTWAGATEALRKGWSRVLVWNHPGYEGNRKLIELGAVPYVLSDERLYDVVTREEGVYEQGDLFELMRRGDS